MKVYQEIGLEGFVAWSGAIETKKIILDNNMGEEFDAIIDELYPNGISETELNDLLWFDNETVFEWLGIAEEEEEE